MRELGGDEDGGPEEEGWAGAGQGSTEAQRREERFY